MLTFTSRFMPSLVLLFAVLSIAGSHALHAAVAATGNAPKLAHEFDPKISAADISADVQVLSSDAFGGRAPTTRGEQQTVDYLSAMLKQTGLQPGNGDSYFQDVPVVSSTVDVARSRMGFVLPHTTKTLKFGNDVVFSVSTGQPEVAIKDSPVIFVGYGIDAPELGWNDYAGIDVTGKTVVILIGIPDVHKGGASLFKNHGFSYYERSSYKFEEAARKGAAAAIIIHDAHDSGFEWDYVKGRYSGAQFSLPRKDDPEPYPPVHGWIAAGAAEFLFDAAGMSLRAMRDAAGKRGFQAVALGDAKLDAAITSSIVPGESKNVIAKLPGTKYPDEAVVYSAHWDHFGTRPNQSGDNIYHGALDNAIGVAAVLEIAAQFAAEDPKPERSIIFLVPTMEELGLLGSKYYTAHPVIPMANTVADINFDVLVPMGLTRNFVVPGLGLSDLDRWMRPFVQRQDRVLEGEPAPDTDSFFRSDHLSFARAGVPVLYVRGGTESRDPAIDGDVLWSAYQKRYHTPADKYDPTWDLRGVVQDLQVSYEVGQALASGHDWPNYREDSQFRAARDATRAAAEQNGQRK